MPQAFQYSIYLILITLISINGFKIPCSYTKLTNHVKLNQLFNKKHSPLQQNFNQGKIAMQQTKTSYHATFADNNIRFRKVLLGLGGIIAAFFYKSKAFAKTAVQTTTKLQTTGNKVSGWDLYGRVPYDDWLFTTSRLTNPNLLRKSFHEAVLLEIPDVLANFKRKRTIHDAFLLGKGLVATCLVLTVLGFWFMRTRDAIKKDREREAAIRGFDMPISAAYKGSKQRGKAVEGMEGWIDMSRSDDDDSKGFWDDDDEEEEEEDTTEKKKPKKK